MAPPHGIDLRLGTAISAPDPRDTIFIVLDGIHPPQEAKGAAHLVVGVHTVRLDYFQGPKDQMAIQLFVTPTGVAEKPLGAALP